MTKHTETSPDLGPVSIDFNKLHAECRSGHRPETALKNAIIEETVFVAPDLEAAPLVADTPADPA